MANKTELEQEVKLLKDKIRQLMTVSKRQDVEDNETLLTQKGFAIVKEDKNFKLVELVFDTESKVGRVVSVNDVKPNPQSRDIALMMAKKYLIEVLFKNL